MVGKPAVDSDERRGYNCNDPQKTIMKTPKETKPTKEAKGAKTQSNEDDDDLTMTPEDKIWYQIIFGAKFEDDYPNYPREEGSKKD